MKKWNRTRMSWPMWGCFDGYNNDRAITSIPVASSPPGTASYHVCSHIEAESQLERNIRCTITFNEEKSALAPRDTAEIRKRLDSMRERFSRPTFDFSVVEFEDGHVVIEFPLSEGEQFCERAFEFVNELFLRFGIKDESGRIRGNFHIVQKTLVMVDGEWLPFERVMLEQLRTRFNVQEPYVYYWTN